MRKLFRYGNHIQDTAIEKVNIARNQNRPSTSDYIKYMCGENFLEIAGDRKFGNDQAIQTGFGLINSIRCAMIGHIKGKDLKMRQEVNFGCAMPEGYRKANRMMLLANELNIPLITLVDTPGAYPGIEAEERGQAHALAECIATLLKIDIPVLSIIHGEGGSGGAIALAVANKTAMLEHAIYSVISPEGCAEILWKDIHKKDLAAEAQKITAQHLKAYGLIDDIIPEPIGGAHNNIEETCKNLDNFVCNFLQDTIDSPIDYRQDRIKRYYDCN